MQLEGISGLNRALIAQLMGKRRRVQKHKRTQDPHAADIIISEGGDAVRRLMEIKSERGRGRRLAGASAIKCW